jgi:hypothetical protein
VEVRDAADHRGAGDEVVAVGDQVRHQLDVTAVALDERVRRVVVVRPGDRAVLGEVVDADNFVTASEELLHEVSADESGGTAYRDLAHVVRPASI